MYKVIVVDDDFFSLHLISDILKNDYELVTFSLGQQLLDYLETDSADLILLDYYMPQQDGIEILKEMKKNPRTASIPVVILTGEHDTTIEIACFKAGAEDFITKPYVPEVVCSRISCILELYKLRENLQQRLDEKTRQMENVVLQAITTVANTVDAKDDYTEEHSVRVAQISALIARDLGWSDKEIYNIYYTGLLHDIGKISVPDATIRKTGALNEEEWKVMKGHTTVGAEILKDIHIVKMAGTVALYHHERYDGRGYPMGLKGEEIPVEARIVGLADAYDAMTSNRAYRSHLSIEQVVAELEEGKGTQFDPELTDVLLKMIREDRIQEIDIQSVVPEEIQKEPVNEGSQLLFKVMEVSNNAVKQEAMKDSLTSLYNRSYAEKKIDYYLQRYGQGAYFMLDMDNFKQVNDRYGHIAGDDTLKEVGKMLNRKVEQGGIACRMGGDEFAIFIYKEMEHDKLKEMAASLLEEYSVIKQGNKNMAETSLSIGIAVAPEDGNSYKELYNAADKALYCSKRGGKNRFCFYGNEMEDRKNLVNIIHLKELLMSGSKDTGSYQVQYKEFTRIYQFIRRCVERTQQKVQILLLSLQIRNPKEDLTELMETELCNLERAVVDCLRRNDVSTRYSNSQIIVILPDTTEENVDIVLERITKSYLALQKYSQYELKCEKMSMDE